MDRRENQCEQKHFHCPPPPAVTISPYTNSLSCANQSLDTVRSLHQTVVSLRNALDDARKEISSLKKQMNVQSVIDEGKTFKENDPGHQPIEDKTKESNKEQKMGSQIDVKIRVSSNLNVSTAESVAEDGKGGTSEATPRSVVNIKLTSQEKLNVLQQEESVYSFNHSVNEEVKIEADREEEEEEREGMEPMATEANDMNQTKDEDSDGDNSVFDDSKDDKVEDEKKHILLVPHQKLVRAHSDTQEEVDDIELVFSSDDHRELHEEEMVSISATYEPWQKPGGSGTPVLLSFERLSIEDQERPSTLASRKQTSLDEHRQVNRTSYRKESSMDTHSEDHQRAKLINSEWQNRKDFHMADISKCGISEENIMDMSRRNTCPNPPAYRPVIATHGFRDREVLPMRTTRNSLSANRCILGSGGRQLSTRPVIGGYVHSSPGRVNLRSPLIAITNAGNARGGQEATKDGPKRSSSVQTDISALPDSWQSESHLAGGGGFGNGMFTLPSKFNPLLNRPGHCPRAQMR